MSTVLWCPIHGFGTVLVIEGQTLCGACRGPMWPKNPRGYEFTRDDLAFLKAISGSRDFSPS